jgi:hypothetical protein
LRAFISNVIIEGEQSLKPTSTASRLILVSFLHHYHPPSTPRHPPNHTQQPGDEPLPSDEGCGLNQQHPRMPRTDGNHPLPFPKGCGPVHTRQGELGKSAKEWGMEKREGGPRNWEAHTVRHETNHDLPSWFISPILHSISPPLITLDPNTSSCNDDHGSCNNNGEEEAAPPATGMTTTPAAGTTATAAAAAAATKMTTTPAAATTATATAAAATTVTVTAAAATTGTAAAAIYKYIHVPRHIPKGGLLPWEYIHILL